MVKCLKFQGRQKSLADEFEYVMHGLLYKISDDESGANPEKYVYIYRLLHLKVSDRGH